MAETFPELAIALVDAPELTPHVAELARRSGVDIAALEKEYEPEVQQAIREAGINPLNLAAYKIATRLVAKSQREKMRRLGIDPARAVSSAGPSHRSGDQDDKILRRFGIDPEKFQAFRDALAARARGTQVAAAGEAAQHQKPAPVSFINPPSAPEPVSAADVLAQLTDTIRAHVIMDEAAVLVTALWAMHTHVLEAFANTPRLVIRSRQPSSGKTTLLTLLSLLTPRPLDFCGGAGTAVLWTLGYRPTLLIDDAVSVIAGSRQLQAILRSGAQRTGAKLLGPAKTGAEVVDIFIPAALAVRGKFSRLLAGRCIEINLRRLHAGQRVARLYAGSNQTITELQRKIARWAADAAQQLRAIDTGDDIDPM